MYVCITTSMYALKDLLSISLLKDIRFRIILFFAVRLYGINNPPLEMK